MSASSNTGSPNPSKCPCSRAEGCPGSALAAWLESAFVPRAIVPAAAMPTPGPNAVTDRLWLIRQDGPPERVKLRVVHDDPRRMGQTHRAQLAAAQARANNAEVARALAEARHAKAERALERVRAQLDDPDAWEEGLFSWVYQERVRAALDGQDDNPDPEPVRPGKCDRCGTSYDACTRRVLTQTRACCAGCSSTEHHPGMNTWEAWRRRQGNKTGATS